MIYRYRYIGKYTRVIRSLFSKVIIICGLFPQNHLFSFKGLFSSDQTALLLFRLSHIVFLVYQ